MNELAQTVIVGLVAAAALGYLVRRAVQRLHPRPRQPGAAGCGACSGCGGCPSTRR